MLIDDENEVKQVNILEVKLKEANELCVKEVKIKNEAEVIIATNYMLKMDKIKKELTEERMAQTRPLDESKKRIMDFFRPTLDKLEDKINMWRRSKTNYIIEQENIRQEKEAELADKQRKEAEALKKKAEAEEKKGNIEKSAVLLEKAEMKEMTPTPVIPKQNFAGASLKTYYHYKITNINLVPREYLIENDSMLSKKATDTKGKIIIPGVEFYETKGLAQRR